MRYLKWGAVLPWPASWGRVIFVVVESEEKTRLFTICLQIHVILKNCHKRNKRASGCPLPHNLLLKGVYSGKPKSRMGQAETEELPDFAQQILRKK